MANTTDRSEESQAADVTAANDKATAATASATAAKSESTAADVHAKETTEAAAVVKKEADKA